MEKWKTSLCFWKLTHFGNPMTCPFLICSEIISDKIQCSFSSQLSNSNEDICKDNERFKNVGIRSFVAKLLLIAIPRRGKKLLDFFQEQQCIQPKWKSPLDNHLVNEEKQIVVWLSKSHSISQMRKEKRERRNVGFCKKYEQQHIEFGKRPPSNHLFGACEPNPCDYSNIGKNHHRQHRYHHHSMKINRTFHHFTV